MRLLIDTDPGMGTYNSDPEDSFAITLAARSPEATLAAVTTVQGNVPQRHGYANAAHVLSLIGAEGVELAAGARTSLLGPGGRPEQQRWLEEKDRRPRVIPAADPPYPGRPAAECIRAHAEGGDLTIVAIGPLTNVATALRAYPELPSLVQRLVVMGGAFEEPGNITPTAEFNFFMDPEAAAIVLDSGLDVTLVGLDVCHRTSLTAEDIEAHHTGSPFGAFVRESCAEWLQTMRDSGHKGLHLFDSLAVAAAVAPELFTLEPAWVTVDTSPGPLAGTSAAWLPGRPSAWTRPSTESNARVATAFDAQGFYALFRDRVLSLM